MLKRLLQRICALALIYNICVTAEAKSLADIQADSLMGEHVIITVKNGQVESSRTYDPEIAAKFGEFYYDQFRNAQDPEAPYFMFLSKDKQMMMGLGGVVRMRGWYDWGGAIPANGFSPILIPMQPDPTNMRHLGTTPAGVCLFFRIGGENKLLGNYQVYIEANFNGYAGRDFHLKKAYMSFRDFTVGYASSTFSDPAAVPSTVDASGPSNKLSQTAVLVRYMPHITANWIAGVSVESPEKQIAADSTNTEACSDYIPNFAALMQYEWATGQHVRLAGIVRSMPYRDMTLGENRNVTGWGLQLSSVAHPIDQLTTYLTANYGAGYANLGGDLLAGAYDLIGDPDRSGYMYAPRSFGWCLGVQYNFLPNLLSTIIASQTRYMPSKAVAPDEYKYGLLGTINLFWNPIPRIQLGAEFDFAKRQNFSGEHRYARRIGVVAQVSF